MNKQSRHSAFLMCSLLHFESVEKRFIIKNKVYLSQKLFCCFQNHSSFQDQIHSIETTFYQKVQSFIDLFINLFERPPQLYQSVCCQYLCIGLFLTYLNCCHHYFELSRTLHFIKSLCFWALLQQKCFLSSFISSDRSIYSIYWQCNGWYLVKFSYDEVSQQNIGEFMLSVFVIEPNIAILKAEVVSLYFKLNDLVILGFQIQSGIENIKIAKSKHKNIRKLLVLCGFQNKPVGKQKRKFMFQLVSICIQLLLFKSNQAMAEQETQISIEDLELALQVYEIESEQKLEQLKKLFQEKGSLDLSKMFYEERSSIEIKFQNIVEDLKEFLVVQEAATTEKLRKTFYRILENPLILLFKISRFQIFNLRLDGFDIEMKPIEAIAELAKNLYQNIDEYLAITAKPFEYFDGKEYKSWESFIEQATINKIQDKIFVFYSYLRKGAKLFKNNFENKVKIVEIFTNVETKILPVILKREDTKTVRELSTLNFEIYELEPSFDVLYFYLQIPLIEKYKQSFTELEILGAKAKQASNYNIFILLFVKHEKQILQKLTTEVIDPIYKSFVENALKSILEMWGCRICYYRQFCELFKALFKLHPNQVEVLELCLQLTPNMQKDDIVLLRTNFKLEIQQKNSQFLSLLKSIDFEEVNEFLNSFYHKTFYTMDFKSMEREKIISLLTLMNGNSSLAQLFIISERAFKEWNHTIDFNHAHKFIETEFAYPTKINEEKIRESLILLTNLCALEEKGFNKEYESLIKANSFSKSLLEFVRFLQRDEKSKHLLSWPETHRFLFEAFNFLRKALNPATQTQGLASAFSTILKNITTQQYRTKLQQALIKAIENGIQSFHIENCLNCFLKYQNKDFGKIINFFLAGTNENNEIVRKFAYLDQTVDSLKDQTVSKEHQQFIESKYRIHNNILTFKDPGIFNISDLEVMTIPSQIDKVIDNYYFTLDSNSKKFIEYLVQVWNQQRLSSGQDFAFYNELIKNLIDNYPIAVPLLSSTRVNVEGGSRRFVELLSEIIGQQDVFSEILLKIIRIRAIRYKNGKDYIQEEVVPMAMKDIIRNINENNQVCGEKLLVLSLIIQRSNLFDLKLETIQKSIEKIRFILTNETSSTEAQKYAKAFTILMASFFSKKQMQMKKNGLVSGYESLIWNEVRNYVSNTTENKAEIKNQPITEFIVITPFTITHEFNIEEYRIKKFAPKNKAEGQKESLALTDTLKKLPVTNEAETTLTFKRAISVENNKKLLLTNSKYDLNVYLGKENVASLASKENIDIIVDENESAVTMGNKKKADDNTSFIQYYMKSLSMPSVNHKLILENVSNLLKQDDPHTSFLWTNSKNLQNYFMALLSIFQFAALEPSKRNSEKDQQIVQIVELVNADSQGVIKKILKLFAKLGYSNIWAQSFDMFWNNFPIRKFLGFGKSEESFLSLILRNILELPEYRQDLTNFLGELFRTRSDQNALMYKVTMDRNLMNVIMKSLSIPHLEKISLLFHSNFNNLRLYTDQLHEGLKALNIASRNRAYNEYIKISKSVEDEQFYGPLKLFKQNFSFFIRIEKEGYVFKKNEETNLVLGRLSNIFRSGAERENISTKVNQVMDEYIKQVTELQLAIANRVKSFYLVTKLRDLSYQNSLMIPIINEVMVSTGKTGAEIIEEINKVEIFSLMSRLYNDLIRYEDDWRNIDKYSSSTKVDGFVLENQLTICSTKRFSHSISKVYQKCDLQFDEVMQRCIDALKGFFGTETGSKWLQSVEIYPAFLVKSFVDSVKANSLAKQINKKLLQNSSTFDFTVQEDQLVEGLLKGFRAAPRSSFVSKGISITYKNEKKSPAEMLVPLSQRLKNNETFVTLKTSNNIIFNKFKSSQATLEQIQVFGFIISYALLNKTPLKINLHPSIVSALSFNIAQLDHLLDIDFKIWEELRNVLSVEDSSALALNFSYNFESLDNFKPIRIELIDKGSSKKVNNLNRDEYADLVCCYILYENTRPQINRLLSTILSIVPKQLISCLSTKEILSLFYDTQKVQKILDEFMKKIGVVLPETLIDENGKRIENLKDFQNVQWLQQCILESPQLRAKFWRDEQNLFVVTSIGGKGALKIINGKFLVEHFGSKEELKAALNKL